MDSSTTAAQRTLCIENPHDVSNILFNNPTCSTNNRGGSNSQRRIEPFVGPIQVVLTAENNNNEEQKQQQPFAVVHGRGVVATRKIQAGELLLATSPSIQANVETVKELWKSQCRFNKEDSSSTTTEQQQRGNLLEACTEEVLVQAMLQASNDVAASFMCLVGTSSKQDDSINAGTLDVPSLDVLNVQNSASMKSIPTRSGEKPTPTRDELLRVIRHNAFGPDGLQSYDHVERIWRSECQEVESCYSPAARYHDYLPPRLLGIYPLAAMLNHSCVANAVRVYAGDIMLVHASSDIAQGQEIVWSYLPPTWPYETRVQTLQSLHGFVCRCPRCLVEQEAYDNNTSINLAYRLKTIDGLNRPFATNYSCSQNQDNQKQLLFSAIAMLENDILRETALSNEMRRYLRVGYTQVYIRHLNTELACLPTNTADFNKRREELLMLCMQLHFSFCACHNASTEHLSILHLCYELVSVIYRDSPPDDKSNKLRFWTDQLKRAHMIRYGSLGNDLENVRKVMQHSRTVLRNLDGIHLAQHLFL